MDKRFLDIVFQKLARNAPRIDLKLRALHASILCKAEQLRQVEFARKMKGKPFFGLRRE
jgi:hypothetical protein